MPVHNADITAIFDEIANLLVERGDNLTRLSGIGADLAGKINEAAQAT
jgi:predicted flap endonuclease-1-like 5' DNA nuclease